MEFYEEHLERLTLREWLRMQSPRVLLAFYVWLMFKIRLASVKTSISMVKGDIRERLIELDQVPEDARPRITPILDHFAEQGFVDFLLESYLYGRNRDHLKLVGVRILARHKSGRCVVAAPIFFGEADGSYWGESGLHTFIDAENSITSEVGSQRFDRTPGNVVTYYPECRFEELLEHHRHTIANRGDTYVSIHNQDDMLTYLQLLENRAVQQLVQRGYLVPFEPEEGPDLPEVVEYGFKPVEAEKQPLFPGCLIFVVALIITILWKLWS